MGCGCGKKKRMATYSSRQLEAQAAGVADDAMVASTTVMSTSTGQPERSTVDTTSKAHGGPHGV